jgi:hypothetical protein
MQHWQIQARHSPCVVKRATLRAVSEDEALKEFVRLNIETAQRRHAKNWKVVVRCIEEWMRLGGLDEVDVVEVEAPVLPDVEMPPEAVQDAGPEAPEGAVDAVSTHPAGKRSRRRKVPVIATAEPVTVSAGGDEAEADLKFVV